MTEEKTQFKQTEIKKDDPVIPMIPTAAGLRLSSGQLPKLNVPHNGSLKEATQYYYKEYLRLYRQNMLLNNQLKCVLEQKNILAEKHNDLKKANSQQEQKRKRHRRNANQIPRNYQCPYSNCQKAYGSEGSLTQHVKLKHPQFYTSGEYEYKVNQNEPNNKNQKNKDSYDQ